MSQDLRELFKKEREKEKPRMNHGHQERFLERLEDELPKAKKSYLYVLKIAATVLLFITAGYFAFEKYAEEPIKQTIVKKDGEIEKRKGISLGDLSPDLKKVENYYVANINLELSKLAVSDDNKALVDSYMEQLESLDTEYKRLNKELNEIGPNDQTISALIQNLQLRLQLLQKLKKKLNDLNTSKNEQVETNII
ncbi:hypothetical protein FEE95_19790 [Maribacter algarum]|uniref:Anti-sigma factor n=1 Tax=Maribacter algarum (ex Zhang et al. 2020) TaxID=2578118 RepID=A0A5S3PGP1_9FLAO|nr:hypothetical protein [Maribacter algarum]TMM53308.1 hypothetical protein FEE95_19790 [Maribacter algarum]